MRGLRKHLSYSNVAATMAVTMAMTGGAYAAGALPTHSVGAKQIVPNAVTSSKVKNGSLRAADFKAGELPTGPRGPQGPPGSNATINGVAAGGDLAGAYPNPTIGKGKISADKLVANEAWRQIGAANQPAFENDWRNFNGLYETAAFRKDRDGIVHVRGVVARQSGNGGGSYLFTLPAGYRPADVVLFSVASFDGSGNQSVGSIQIDTDGHVFTYAATDDRFVSFDGVSFDA
jgi:hypothetical protein